MTEARKNIHVLFIDDEGFWAMPYRKRLETEFGDGDVAFFDDPTDGLKYFNDTPAVDIVLLDVVMPTPEGASQDATDHGRNSGLWLLAQMRAILIERQVPVIILTNRSRQFVEANVTDLEFPAGLVEIRLKSETPAFFLPSRVKLLVVQWRGGR